MIVACSWHFLGPRSGAPWRDLPAAFGPHTLLYRFVRWRRAGVWDQIMDALAAGHDAAVAMIDTSVVRVHQHGACIRTTIIKIWVAREGPYGARFTRSWTPSGLPIRLALTLVRHTKSAVLGSPQRIAATNDALLADRGYDADWIRELARQQGAWANIPPETKSQKPICSQPVSVSRTQLDRTVLQQDQAISARRDRYDQLAANYWRCKIASIAFASVNESTP